MTAPLNRILLIDDDRVTNLMHRRLIEKAGLARRIDVAVDGVEALSCLATALEQEDDIPELLLLDINMPRMNGFEFLEAYDALPDHLRRRQLVIMLTTSVLTADMQRAAEDPNVFRFVTKPVDGTDMMGFVRDYCAARRA